MLRLFYCCLLLFCSFLSSAQSFEEIQQKYTEGVMAYQNGDIQKASSILELAVAMAQRSFGQESLEAASPMGTLGIVYTAMGQYNKAEPLLLTARKIIGEQHGKNDWVYAGTCTNLFNLYAEQGLYDKAEIFVLEAHEVTKSFVGRENQEFGKSYFNLAMFYSLKEDYAKADSFYEEASNAWKGVVGEEHLLIAALNDGKAHAASRQGRYEKSRELFQKSLAIKSKTIGKDHIDYARTCNNYSVLLYSLDETKLAIEYAEKAIAIYKSQLGDNHPNVAVMIRNLSIVYTDLDENDKALELAKEARRISEEMGKQSISYALSCAQVGYVYTSLDELELAQGFYKESREIFETNGRTNDTEYLKIVSGSALMQESRKNFDKAESFHSQANQLTLQIIERQFSTLSEEEKRLYFKTFGYQLGTFYSFVTKRYLSNPHIAKEAYNMMLATKGLLFESSDKIRRRVKQSKDPSVKKLFADWQSQRKQISKAQMLTSTERIANGIVLADMEENANRLEKELATRSALFSKFQDKAQPNWRNIRDQLKPGEAAIELVRLSFWEKEWQDSTIYMALILKPETLDYPEIQIIANGDYLETKGLSKYQKSIQFKVEDATSYQTYWKGLASKLDGVKKVYLAPYGVYNAISLNGLLNPETGKYLREEVDIRLVKSTRDLLSKSKKKARAGRRAKLIGHPEYNNLKRKGESESGYFELRSLSSNSQDDSLTRFFDGSNIPVLPGTKREIENLSAILEDAGIANDRYLNTEADESAIKSWKSPLIAHIATHGYFLKDQNMTSKKDKIGGISSEVLLENPLLRSGLLFAGAKHAIAEGGDGVLTAYEAMNLDLDDTELVVLSACETGLGEIRNGEGVYGLHRAFQAAGAKTIIMSLWTVNDDATQQLMTAFYSSWLTDGHTKSEAFKIAQANLALEYPHPYYWAAFVMIGEE